MHSDLMLVSLSVVKKATLTCLCVGKAPTHQLKITELHRINKPILHVDTYELLFIKPPLLSVNTQLLS